MKKIVLILIFISINHVILYAQQPNNQSNSLILETLSDDIIQLNKKVTFSISNIELYQFLRALGVNNKLNLDIDQTLSNQIAVNFTDVAIKDLLIYLGDQYDLDFLVTGNIITIKKHFTPPPIPPPIMPKNPTVSYNKSSKLLSFDLQNDTLWSVLKKVTNITNYNIFTESSLRNTLISGYAKDLRVADAISELAKMNNLSFKLKDTATIYLQKKEREDVQQNFKPHSQGHNIITNKLDSILSINVIDVPIVNILNTVSDELGINYFLLTEIKGNINIQLENIDFNTFLELLLKSTPYSYKKVNDIYLIGEKKEDEIRDAQVYVMKHRTVSNIAEKLPSNLKKNVEVITSEDLNSLIITGPQPAVKDLIYFLEQIDKVIPVINIELIILDIRRSHTVSTGIMAGIDNDISKSSYASVFPDMDITLSANTINNIINGINGSGLVNLGKVTPGFYVSLKASEDNGNLRIRSTPRLATLNGKEASMTIGETRYYIEQTTNVITTQSTTTVTGINYKELQANFGITIKPIVSGDEQITLDIAVEQSTFTEQATKNGPYGRLTRSFQSSVRVRNNDLILLGGLEEKNRSDAGKGFPILSRIPIIKWLFSSRSLSNKKSKLVILIHPTVFY